MGREYKAGEECVPGYRLAKFLGRGGFGEVWRAVGPGGTEVALKIIALDRKQGMKEFRSLRLVKRIHHPNLVPILAFWLIDANGTPLEDESIDLLGTSVIDGSRHSTASTSAATMQFNAARAEQLIIAMGLGEKNLLDVLKEYQAKGLTGIPLDELLDYMEGSARAIDFLNTARHELGGPQPVAIQHCDIKPQNIMLVGDAVQVCDFGLARSLSDVRSTSVAASIAYGAPELFWENKPTHATDQYSLAITYYELRTGHLPFGPDSAAIEVMQAHRDGKLDFHHLNDAERAVVKRATDPSPAGRFEKTIDMVRALQRAARDVSRPFPAPLHGTAIGIRSSFVHTGREIVPGYTLQEHLFHPDARTDVWSASAPGGTGQALWIYDLSAVEGSIDRDALDLIKALTDHPRLARLSGWWELNAGGHDVTHDKSGGAAVTLAMASELTRTNMAHRVEESRQFRGKGMPGDELMPYMQQVAEGVDALNEATHSLRGSRRVSLVHTDLRPANLLVFGRTIKVGNYAWCRILEGEENEIASMPVRTSRPTMAPELAAGRIHCRSDQYSLAASYVQMRSGNLLSESGLPTGAASGVVANSSLDFSCLSDGELEIIQRAMHADPSQRYASCHKMVAELALALKKVPVGVVEPVYREPKISSAPPVREPAGGGYTGTMMPADLLELDTKRGTTAVAAPPSPPNLRETAPVRETIPTEEPKTMPSPRTGRRFVAGGAVVLIAAVATTLFLTGSKFERSVHDQIKERQYKAAIELLDNARFWQRVFLNLGTLRRSIILEAIETAKDDAGTGKIPEACQAIHELRSFPELLTTADLDEFREGVLPAAIKYAEDQLQARHFQSAHDIQAQLNDVFKDNDRVVALGERILERATQVIDADLRQDLYNDATRAYEELSSFADDHKTKTLRSRIVDGACTAIAARSAKNQVAEAVGIYKDVKQVSSHLTSDENERIEAARQRLVREAVASAISKAGNGQIDDASATYRELATLPKSGADVEDLGTRLLDKELETAHATAKKGDWETALGLYRRASGDWTQEWAGEQFNVLKGEIILAAEEKFNDAFEKKNRTVAQDIADRLHEIDAFATHPRVEAMIKKLDDVPSPVSDLQRLLAVAEQDIGDGLLEQAKNDLDKAESRIKEQTGHGDLIRQLAVLRAYLAVECADFDQATQVLAGLKDSDSGPAERRRLGLLRFLAQARFNGRTLRENADLESLATMVGQLTDSDRDWKQSDDRPLVKAVEKLIEQVVVSATRQGPEVAARVNEILPREYIDRLGPVQRLQLAVAATRQLLADQKTTFDQIKDSTGKWPADADALPPEDLAAFGNDLARWARATAEPDSMNKAAELLRAFGRRNEALRRERAGLLIEQLAMDAATDNIDFTLLHKECDRIAEDVKGHPREYFVNTCLAECLLEEVPASSAEIPLEAQSSIADALKATISPSDQAYVDYVALRLDQEIGRSVSGRDPASLADELCTSLEPVPTVLNNTWRRSHAADLLIGAARGLAVESTGDNSLIIPSFGPSDADRAYRWLLCARKLSDVDGKAMNDYRLFLACAALQKSPADHQTADLLLDDLLKEELTDPAALLVAARNREGSVDAVRHYAAALKLLRARGATSSNEVYEKVVAPAIRIFESLSPQQQSSAVAEAAELYAALGRLIRHDPSVQLAVRGKTNKTGAGLEFDAYDRAIRLNGNRADYYIQRGRARFDSRPTNADELELLKKEDLNPARKYAVEADAPGLSGLSALVDLMEARLKDGWQERQSRIKAYKQAVREADDAANLCDKDDDYAQFLLLHSMACLELANYTTEPDSDILGYLKDAIDSAQLAINDGRARLDYAYQARGNAEEDHGLLLRQFQGYKDAAKTFGTARDVAKGNLFTPEAALVCLGRVAYRRAKSGAEPPQQIDKLLASGLNDLIDATKLGQLSNDRMAEAYSWQALIYWEKAGRANAAPAAQGARAAADGAMKECMKYVAPDNPFWPHYQLQYAGAATTTDEMRRRGLEVLNAPKWKSDSATRAQGAFTVASTYPAQDRPKQYVGAMPWGRDIAKAGAGEIDALLKLSELVLYERPFPSDANAAVGKQSAERARALADQERLPWMSARAHAILATFEAGAAKKTNIVDLEGMERALDHLKAAVDFDEKLANSGILTAIERQSVRDDYAPNWRLDLAAAAVWIKNDRRTPDAHKVQVRQDGISALKNAKQLPKHFKKQFDDMLLKL